MPEVNSWLPDPTRSLSLLVAKLRRPVPSGVADRQLPILMYHSVSHDEDSRTPGYYRMTTHPEVFRRQMDFLADSGYEGVSLEVGLAALDEPESSHRRLVVLTFDDGFRDFYDEAWRLLRARGFGASVFLPTRFITEPRSSFEKRPCLSWSEVLELRRSGIRFGSHTRTHPVLHRLAWGDIRRELIDSKKELEDRLQERVVTFCHPYAFPQADGVYCTRLRTELREAGYEAAVTTRLGRARKGDDRLLLRRLPVSSLDDPILLAAKLVGGSDWLLIPQYLSSWLRHRPRRS